MLKQPFFSKIISQHSKSPKILFQSINRFLNSNTVSILPSTECCEKFLNVFLDKVNTIRSGFHDWNGLTGDILKNVSTFDKFDLVSVKDISLIIGKLKRPAASWDVLPFDLLAATFDYTGPCITAIVNCSLYTGTFPLSFKQAVIQPLLKKTTLDPLDFNNYRPISKLPYISKILEKVVLFQLSSFLARNEVLDVFQSGFRAGHSTESALLRVSNDLLLIADSGNTGALIMLDLSAAFDLIDHDILINRLEHVVGLRGTVLKWFSSYLRGRSISVRVGDFSSGSVFLDCGVPQGSILGPILFSLFLLPLGQIFKKYGISYHLYADDIQIYLPIGAGGSSPNLSLVACLKEVTSWLQQNCLQLNASKSEVMVFGMKKDDSGLADFLGIWETYVQPKIRNLGVIFDSALMFDHQVKNVVKNCFYQLRTIAKMKSFLSVPDLETVIHAFISTRLDYCNALYVGISQSLISRLQLVQNAAARLLTGIKKREHITPVLKRLHWLPVKYRIQYKVLLYVYKAVHELAPEYIKDLVLMNSGRSQRSFNCLLLFVPRTRLKTKGDRAFSVVGPRLWNALPPDIRSAPSVDVFKTRVKTYLYSVSFNS